MIRQRRQTFRVWVFPWELLIVLALVLWMAVPLIQTAYCASSLPLFGLGDGACAVIGG